MHIIWEILGSNFFEKNIAVFEIRTLEFEKLQNYEQIKKL